MSTSVMGDCPIVTVAISAFNAEPFVADACRSILAQTHEAIELFVVDDGSTDATADIVDSIDDSRIRLYRQSNSGKSVAMNHILDHMRGEYLMIQDADDLSDPERVECQLAAFLAEPALGGVYCGHRLILNGQPTAPRVAPRSPEECKTMIRRYLMPAHDPTLMVRTEIARRLRFNPDFRIGQGYDFTLRLGEQQPLRVLGDCMYSYRANPKSVTRQNAERRQHYVDLVLASARARRGVVDQTPLTERRNKGGHVHADNNLVGHFVESVRYLRLSGRHLAAIRVANTCLGLHPLDWRYYKPLANCVAPLSTIEWWRSRRLRSEGGDGFL